MNFNAVAAAPAASVPHHATVGDIAEPGSVRTQLARSFSRAVRSFRSEQPLSEDQMRQVAPSIFAADKHASRSERYTYIPTIDILRGLRREGFEAFMVAQGGSRVPGKAEYTKHLIRLRHQGGHGQVVNSRAEAPEIILINSHDGASSYQMIAGLLRHVCMNGLVVGSNIQDVRIPHKGHARDQVVEGAFRVLEQFEQVDASVAEMKALPLKPAEERAFATGALALRFGERGEGQAPLPVTVEQVTAPRRAEDVGTDLWRGFQRVQEALLRGGVPGRGATGQRITTRPVQNIDRGVSLNRALWVLAEEMRKLKT
jgi:hypothetical protein